MAFLLRRMGSASQASKVGRGEGFQRWKRLLSVVCICGVYIYVFFPVSSHLSSASQLKLCGPIILTGFF
ncbi:uncharacterized protein BJX67DRAFT_129060 [Aspergillus lucknowensis]|uniref:Uncharacterized protein n=1 Tax=Aspergillus lucknowensis TaxID=176173 RepID=A0ABR4LQH1_9EURO